MSARAQLNQERQIERSTNSQRYAPRTSLYKSFADDGFDFRDAPTNGTTALKLAPRVTVADSANTEQLAYAQSAGERLQVEIAKRRATAPAVIPVEPALAPMVLRQLPLMLPAPRTLTSVQYAMTGRTPDDFEAYLRGVVERCEVRRKEKATMQAVA